MGAEPEDLGGGVWSIPVPIPGSRLARTLVYALESERGPVLIDAGWNHPDAEAALRAGLAAFGMDLAEVHGVIVTHFHPDHAGLAGRVREASGAWIAMHPLDTGIVRFLRDAAAANASRWQAGALRRAGAGDAELAEELERPPLDPPAEPDRDLADGERADVPGRRLRAVWTPGHTPGHLCLHLEDGDRIFTGDHVLPRITPHIGLYPYDRPKADPLGDYLRSLERVASVSAREVLPAHQYRFTGLAARAKEIIEHHEERLTEVAGLLSAEPTTLWSVAAQMRWRDEWTAMPLSSRQMAAGEAAAHLRTLENRGLARSAGTPDLRYTR